jgi:hypothetical protein
MISNDVLDDLRIVGCGEGDDARQEDMRAASAAYDEIVRLREKCDRQAMILRRLTPENFPNTYFICGEAGERDINGLPEKILVVPAYGVDWNMTYQRTDKVFGPEW